MSWRQERKRQNRLRVVWAGACAALLWGGATLSAAATRFAGPWDLRLLRQVPAATWGAPSNLVREVYYRNVPYRGRQTRVFGFYGRPGDDLGPYPAVVLVHGGGQRAFPDWAASWAKRGYVALAMDLSGQGPNGPLPDGGPSQTEVFKPFTDADVNQTWMYHAVAAVVRGLSLVAAQPEVDGRRIAVHGLSFGGVIACTVVGLDERPAAAAPVFGAGYLYEDSQWLGIFEAMSCADRLRWINNFDPSRYLVGVSCPILFASGLTDIYFPPNSFQHSYRGVPGPVQLAVRPSLPHGGIWEIPGADTEVNRFVDATLNGGAPLPQLGAMRREGDTVTAAVASQVPLLVAQLHYTTNLGAWSSRVWWSQVATLTSNSVTATLPAMRPLVYFLSVTDTQRAFVSAPYATAGAEDQQAVLRFTNFALAQPGQLNLSGRKPLGHRVLIQASTDRCGWQTMAADSGSADTFSSVLSNQFGVGPVFYRARDVDW